MHEGKVSVDGVTYTFLITTNGISWKSIHPVTDNLYVKFSRVWVKGTEFMKHYLSVCTDTDVYVSGIKIGDFKLEV